MRERRPGPVLLDITLGWPLDGLSIGRRMLSDHRLLRTPIIMIAAIPDSRCRGLFPQD